MTVFGEEFRGPVVPANVRLRKRPLPKKMADADGGCEIRAGRAREKALGLATTFYFALCWQLVMYDATVIIHF